MDMRESVKITVPVLIIAGILSMFLYFSYKGTFSPPFVSAVASSLLVLVTAVSVILTSTLLQEQKEANRREVKPIIRLDVVPVSIGGSNSIIENVGNGLAQDVTATLKLQPDGPEWTVAERNVRIDDKIPAFAPDEVDFRDTDYEEIELTGNVTDMFNECYEIDDIYELGKASNRGYLPYDDGIADKLGDIESELSDIEKAISKIR